MANKVPPDITVIDSPILYWVNNARKKIDHTKMKCVIKEHFQPEEILETKHLLAELVDSHHKANHSDESHPKLDRAMMGPRKSHDLALGDILSLLDHTCSHDLKCIFANSSHDKLPPLSPVDCTVDILWLIQNAKSQLNRQNEIDNQLSDMRSDIQTLISAQQQQRATPGASNANQPHANHTLVTNSSTISSDRGQLPITAVHSHPLVESGKSRTNNGAPEINPGANAYTPPAWNIGNHPPYRRDRVDSSGPDVDFQTVRRRKPKSTYGSNANQNKLSAGKPVQNIFVSQMAPGVEASTILEHLKSFPQFDSKTITVQLRESRVPEAYSSAIVTFIDCTWDQAFDADVWPDGVFLKEWIGRVPTSNGRQRRPDFKQNG